MCGRERDGEKEVEKRRRKTESKLKKTNKERGKRARQRESMTDPAFLIQQIKQAQLSLYEVDAQLIVNELNPAPGQLLPEILLLLQVEHMLQKNTS